MNRGHRFRSKPLPVRLSGRAARQANREHRTLARFAGHGHISAHHACERARQRKAEAGSTVTPREVGFRNRPWPVVDAAASTHRSHGSVRHSDHRLYPALRSGHCPAGSAREDKRGAWSRLRSPYCRRWKLCGQSSCHFRQSCTSFIRQRIWCIKLGTSFLHQTLSL